MRGLVLPGLNPLSDPSSVGKAPWHWAGPGRSLGSGVWKQGRALQVLARGVLELLEEGCVVGVPSTPARHKGRSDSWLATVIIMCDLVGFITPLRALVPLNPPSDTGLG